MTHGSIRSRDFHYAVIGEGTSSRQLHTAPLPAPHVPVGYRLYTGFSVLRTSYWTITQPTSRRTRDPQ
jgi:hypothetical protein